MTVLVIATAVVYVLDSATLVLLYRRLTAPVRVRDMFAIKGVSYFFNTVNYGLAAGSIALFVHKRYPEVGFVRALSAMMWMSFVDVLVLTIVLAVGWLVGSGLLPDEQVAVLPYVLATVACIAVGAFVYWHLGVDFWLLGRLRHLAVFDAFRAARLSDYGTIMGARLAMMGVYIVTAYFLMGSFDIVIGFIPLLVYMPLLTFMQIVPAQISGLGAIQELMILLLTPFVAASVIDPRAEVFAYSLAAGPMMALVRLLIGYAFIRGVARDFRVSRQAINEAQAGSES